VPKSNGKNLNTGSCPDALTRYMSEISKIKPLWLARKNTKWVIR